jgi:hypothetical protein
MSTNKLDSPKYLNHVCLNTGRCRQSHIDEVNHFAIAAHRHWLSQAIKAKCDAPLPYVDMSEFTVSTKTDGTTLLVTVLVHYRARLVTMGISPNASDPLLMALVKPSATHVKVVPNGPVCARHHHEDFQKNHSAIRWLAGFEKNIAWAWLLGQNPSSL